MLSDKVKDVAARIGWFYLQKNNGDYKQTEHDITALRISKIEVTVGFNKGHDKENEGISITLSRPGLLIGKKGTNIDALSKHLKTHIKIIEEVDDLLYWLIPYRDEYEN